MKIYSPKLILATFITALLSACGGSDVSDEKQEGILEIVAPTPSQDNENKVEVETEDAVEGVTQQQIEDVIQQPTEDVTKAIDLSNKLPSKLKISTDGSEVSITWSPILGAQSYNVYYNEADYVGEGDTMLTSATNSFTHQNLDQTTHSYKVQAVYATSLSALSQQMITNLANYNAPVEDSSSE